MKPLSLTSLDLDRIPIFAVGGNHIGHMIQAGEADKDAPNQPKFMFSIWYPSCGFAHPVAIVNGEQPVYLPLELERYDKPTPLCVQTEPELGIYVEFECSDDAVKEITVTHLFPANEVSIRGIKNEKICEITGPKPDYMCNAHRKNWGPGSQSIADNLLPLPEVNVIPDDVEISATLLKDGKEIPYGITTKLGNMTFKNQALWDYIKENFSITENNMHLKNLIKTLGKKFQMFICTGATLYHDPFVYSTQGQKAGHEAGERIILSVDGIINGEKYSSTLDQPILPDSYTQMDLVKQGYPEHAVLDEVFTRLLV